MQKYKVISFHDPAGSVLSCVSACIKTFLVYSIKNKTAIGVIEKISTGGKRTKVYHLVLYSNFVRSCLKTVIFKS